MIYNDKKKWVYISVPKSGTCTMLEVLENFYSGNRMLNGKELHMHHNHLPDKCSKYYKFSMVRNPYSRAVSSWWSATQEEGIWEYFRNLLRLKGYNKNNIASFFQWVLDNRVRKLRVIPQRDHIGHLNLDFIMRLENIDEDFRKLPFHSGKKIKMPVINKANNRKHWKEYLTPEAIRLINIIYFNDFHYYGYERMGT